MEKAVVVAVLLLTSAAIPLPTPVLGQAVPIQFYGPDARSQGMAGAFTAIAEGAAVTWWNPGAVALQKSVYVNPFSYVELVPDLPDDVKLHTFGGAWSRGGFGLGCHITRISYGERLFRDGSGVVLGTFEPTENVVLVGGGVDIGMLLGAGRRSDRFQLGVGSNLRLFDSNIAPAWADPFGTSREGASWDVDLGSLFVYRVPIGLALTASPERRSHLNIRGGFVINNLFNRDIVYGDENEGDTLDRQLRLGGAFEFELGALPPFDHFLKATVSMDYVHGIEHADEAVERFGTELSLLGVFAFRAGHLHEGDAYGECCSINDWAWGLGTGADLELAGLRRVGGRFDFASVITAEGLPRPKLYSISFWLTF